MVTQKTNKGATGLRNKKDEWFLIADIAKRAVIMSKKNGIEYKQFDAVMDIEAVHTNCCELKLQELLDADNGNFGHDVFGIRTNINRETKQLENCFSPRYSK